MKNRGFTIIEMLVMIGLMAVLLVIGFNTFGMYQGRNRQNLRDVSTQFYRDYSLLRMDAIAQNLPMKIQFSEDNPPNSFIKYTFYRYNVVAGSWDLYRVDSGRGVQVRHCGPFVTSTDNTVEIAFNSSGMVVHPDNMTTPQNLTFTFEIQRGAYKDKHDIEIFPSGGIHVTKKLDEES